MALAISLFTPRCSSAVAFLLKRRLKNNLHPGALSIERIAISDKFCHTYACALMDRDNLFVLLVRYILRFVALVFKKEQQSQRDIRKGMNNTLKYKSYT